MTEYAYGNAIICVTRPTLSVEEQAKRERIIENALQLYGKERYRKTIGKGKQNEKDSFEAS